MKSKVTKDYIKQEYREITDIQNFCGIPCLIHYKYKINDTHLIRGVPRMVNHHMVFVELGKDNHIWLNERHILWVKPLKEVDK